MILTNQGGLTLHPDPKSKAPKNLGKNRVTAFKQKCSAVLNQLDIPLTLYAATGKDMCRKPRPGMWAEMRDDYDLAEPDVDLENSVFVGDAGGRTAHVKGGTAISKDFSCSDRNLAHNLGIDFKTPEEFFLEEPPRDFVRDFDLAKFPFVGDGDDGTTFEKKYDQEVVLFCAPPGAGKSTFYWKHLEPLGYTRVNQDVLKRYVNLPTRVAPIASLRGIGYSQLFSKDKCFKAANDYLREGESIVVGTDMPRIYRHRDVG